MKLAREVWDVSEKMSPRNDGKVKLRRAAEWIMSVGREVAAMQAVIAKVASSAATKAKEQAESEAQRRLLGAAAELERCSRCGKALGAVSAVKGSHVVCGRCATE